MKKRCTVCEIDKPLKAFSLAKRKKDGRRYDCKECANKRTAEVATHSRDRWYRRTYGITLADWNTMFELQLGRCAICGTDSPGGSRNRFHVDHCHVTGTVRGLLCYGCNTSLGKFGHSIDTLLQAIIYLSRNEPDANLPCVQQDPVEDRN